jgi:hypothetical protein
MPVQEIDFLPTECRQLHQQRRSEPWLVATALLIVGLVAAAAAVQHWRRHCVRGALADIAPTYQGAVDLHERLAEVQHRLAQVEASAELHMYLRHPWPRTQLLAALVRLLPDGIALRQVEIQPGPPRAASEKAAPQSLESLAPAGRDLLKLRSRVDAAPTVVQLSGVAAESAVLHRYLGDLDALEIFEKAELDFFRSADDGRGGQVLEFRAVLAVQPGYGQPGGPASKPNRKTDRTATVASQQR